MIDLISVKGARVNNLRNIDVDIERNKLTVVTGVSGSGKSSLVFDLIYAEGLSYLLECLPPSVSRFLPKQLKPDVDLITGLSPVFGLKQNKANTNPRSTIGTVTDIYNQLRIIFAAYGTPHCPYCSEEIVNTSCPQLAEQISRLPEGTIVSITAPVEKSEVDSFETFFHKYKKIGYSKFVVDGVNFNSNLDDALDEISHYQHIEVVIDKLRIQSDMFSQILHSLEQAVFIGEGLVRIDIGEMQETTGIFQNACKEHHVFLCELQAKYFIFNNSENACTMCGGTGIYPRVNPYTIVKDENKSLADRAIIPLYDMNKIDRHKHNVYISLLKHYGYSLDTVYKDLPDHVKKAILYGTDGERFQLFDGDSMSSTDQFITYDGLIAELENRYQYIQKTPGYKKSVYDKRFILNMVPSVCPACKGKRLKSSRLLVTLKNKSIDEVAEMPFDELYAFLEDVAVEESQRKTLSAIINDLKNKIRLFIDIGLEYLQMDRSVSTLSGGEYQRIKLCTQLNSKLVGILYILDEPSIGLHEKDTIKIIEVLKKLRDLGNTVLVVEHDFNMIKAADRILELGPGAGEHGGDIVAQGSIDDIQKVPQSLTGKYLNGLLQIEIPQRRRQGNGKYLTIVGATANNLKNIDVRIPLGKFICVTGVSGSGKSTLINDILCKQLQVIFNASNDLPGPHTAIEGTEHIKNILVIDQSPIGWRKNSNPATYIGYYDEIRNLFAQTEEAKRNHFTSSHFSFNMEGGRCEACRGYGYIENVEDAAEAEVLCPECNGKRFSKEVLSILYHGKNIDDVLHLPVSAGIDFFSDNAFISSRLKVMAKLGLGYMQIGQPTHTLSGGESQRVKLATELVKRQKSMNMLYVLDEPTTGLHMSDISKLLICLNHLVDSGNTVLVVEHNLDVVKTADYVIDLGPDGGKKGGYLVAEGSPEEICLVERSYTGQCLKKYL